MSIDGRSAARHPPGGPFFFDDVARRCAHAGIADQALYWLDKAADYGSYELTYIALRPDFDVLRDDPRYPNLVERVYGQRMPELRLPD